MACVYCLRSSLQVPRFPNALACLLLCDGDKLKLYNHCLTLLYRCYYSTHAGHLFDSTVVVKVYLHVSKLLLQAKMLLKIDDSSFQVRLERLFRLVLASLLNCCGVSVCGENL